MIFTISTIVISIIFLIAYTIRKSLKNSRSNVLAAAKRRSEKRMKEMRNVQKSSKQDLSHLSAEQLRAIALIEQGCGTIEKRSTNHLGRSLQQAAGIPEGSNIIEKDFIVGPVNDVWQKNNKVI